MSGASVSIVPPAISVFPVDVAQFIDEHAITVWYSVPSILSLLTEHGNLSVGALPSLRHIVFAGEVFPSRYLSRLMTLLPRARFHNWYGPTETNVCTAYQVPEPPDPEGGDIPIGSAIDNVATFVLRADGSPADVAEEGELYVRGATVMHGYWGDPEKTASKVGVGEGEGSADRVYATGDLVIETPSGDYRFLGRKDHQIKSRGYRIELGEIETALHAHPAVAEAVAVAVPDEIVSNRIWAYVVSQNIDDAALRSWCADRIPKYMIPEHFEFLPTLPRTSTGKIDRQAVQDMGLRGSREEIGVPQQVGAQE
jgi:acyl-coenzyme A synthetase/AMP-(fatty) acid ligase